MSTWIAPTDAEPGVMVEQHELDRDIAWTRYHAAVVGDHDNESRLQRYQAWSAADDVLARSRSSRSTQTLPAVESKG